MLLKFRRYNTTGTEMSNRSGNFRQTAMYWRNNGTGWVRSEKWGMINEVL